MCVAAIVLKIKSAVGIVGKRCAVNGLGSAGLIALQMLRAEGAAETIGLDLNPNRRTLAQQLGVDAATDPRDHVLPQRNVLEPPDIILDCVGYAESVHFAMDHARSAVALFGVQRDNYMLRPQHRGLDIINYPGHYREAAEYALQLVVNGKLDMSPLITRELPLEQYSLAVELLKQQEAVKICFVPK